MDGWVKMFDLTRGGLTPGGLKGNLVLSVV